MGIVIVVVVEIVVVVVVVIVVLAIVVAFVVVVGSFSLETKVVVECMDRNLDCMDSLQR